MECPLRASGDGTATAFRLAAVSVKRVVRTHRHIKTGWYSVWRVAHLWMAAAWNGHAADDGASNLWLCSSGSLCVTFVVVRGLHSRSFDSRLMAGSCVAITARPPIRLSTFNKRTNRPGPKPRPSARQRNMARASRWARDWPPIAGAANERVAQRTLNPHRRWMAANPHRRWMAAQVTSDSRA